MNKRSEVQAAKSAKDMEALGATMATAMQSAGLKKGERPTKAQEQKMEDAMMASMLPKMKQKILAEGKALAFAKECLSDANTLKEAQICENKMDMMTGEPSDPEDKLTKWDAKTKKEILGFIEQGLKGMACVEKANSMQEIKRCMQ